MKIKWDFLSEECADIDIQEMKTGALSVTSTNKVGQNYRTENPLLSHGFGVLVSDGSILIKASCTVLLTSCDKNSQRQETETDTNLCSFVL